MYSMFQGEKDKSHNPKCSQAWRDGQLVLKDTQSPVGSLHVGLMVGLFTYIAVLATLSIFVLHKKQPVLASQS